MLVRGLNEPRRLVLVLYGSPSRFARSASSFGLLIHFASLRTSRLIGQSLSHDRLNGALGAFNVIAAELHSIVMPEVKFCKIPMQVLFLAILIGAAHAALENAEIALGAVGVNVAASIRAVQRSVLWFDRDG
jgi:hypothetical protein